jgi:hypothetical protein
VHLFIDSLLHEHMPSTGYQCSDMDSFSQGLCLSCKKGRCNTLGYHVHQQPHSKSRQLFLVTRAQAPFKGERRRAAWVPYLQGSGAQLSWPGVSKATQAPGSNAPTFLLSSCPWQEEFC